MKRTVYMLTLLSVLSFSCAQAMGKDTTVLFHAIGERLSPYLSIGRAAYDNPALKPYAWSYSLTTLHMYGSYGHEEEPLVMQLGEGGKFGIFQAESYLHLNDGTTLWGNAGYRSGRSESIYLNTTSDLDLLYPYIMADTVGGNVHSETYTFCGGYARRMRKVVVGFCAAYRADIACRKVDPRPRNIVSDLHLSAAVSFPVHDSYLLAFALDGSVYRQRNDVKFMSDVKETGLFQMLGLGMYSKRFSGLTQGVQFDGGGIGFRMDFVPAKQHGLNAFVLYHYSNIKRSLLTFNNLPLTHLKNTSLDLSISWKNMGTELEKGIELETHFADRSGLEAVYGEVVNGYYPKINDAEMYGNKRLHTRLRGIFGWGDRERQMFRVEPRAGFRYMKSTYASPQLSMEVAEVSGGAKFHYTRMMERNILQASLGADYSANVTDKLDIARLTSGPFFAGCMNRQFDALIQGGMKYGADISWNFFMNERLVLAFDGKWQHICLENDNRTDIVEFGCSLGF